MGVDGRSGRIIDVMSQSLADFFGDPDILYIYYKLETTYIIVT